MLDPILVREAFRARLLTLVTATTGSAELAATSVGFTRTVGSFDTDKFEAGMEALAAGFPTSALNTRWIIESVTPTLVKIKNGLPSTAGAAVARSLTVGLPADKRWEGTRTPVTTAPGTRPYIDEQRVPALTTLMSFPANGGTIEERGLYILTWYALDNTGILDLERNIYAIKLLFTPGTVLLVGTSNAVRIWGDPGPAQGQFLVTDQGYLSCQLTIPWRGTSINAIAA